MKKNIVLLLFTFISVGLFSFVLISKTGKAGYTGSPGESTCNNCHNSYALNSGTGSVNIRTNIPNDQYEPDSVYQISITVAKSGVSLFGFGCEALMPNNTSVGTFTVTDVTHTQQLTASNGRKNMTHKLNGGASADSAVFHFNWQAPSSNVGNINFYFTGVCANGNNANSQDYVYKNFHTITPSPFFGIEDVKQPYTDLEIKPFSVAQMIDIRFILKEAADIEFQLLTMDGKQVQSLAYKDQFPGQKEYTLYTSGLQAGIYILQAQINQAFVTRKFLLV